MFGLSKKLLTQKKKQTKRPAIKLAFFLFSLKIIKPLLAQTSRKIGWTRQAEGQ